MAATEIIKEKGTQGVDPRTEVIKGSTAWSGKYYKLSQLPSPLDGDVRHTYLSNELKWMMLRDPQVFAGYMLWKTGVLVDGFQLYPSKNIKDSNGKKSKLREKRANEISEFGLWNLNNLKQGFHMKMLQLLDCCIWGHKAGVQVHRDQEKGTWKGKLVLDRIRIMSNDSYRIRTDEFGNLLGLQPIEANENENIYPMRKFAYACFRPYDDNPVGTNLLWPAYMAWYEKMQIAPERLANMSQFGSPSMYANAPEGVKDIEMVDQYGLPMRHPTTLKIPGTDTPHPAAGQIVKVPVQKQMMAALQNFQGNGSVTVLPDSAKLTLLQAQGNGEVFGSYTNDKNMEIIKAMFFTTGWTESEKYSSNAKGKVSASIGHNSLMDGKLMMADLIEEYILAPLIIMNWGEEYLDLIPEVTLGSMEKGMMASLYNAIAALWSTGFFDDSQRAVLCQKMGLPMPDPNAPRPQQGQPTGNVLVNNKKNSDNQNGSKKTEEDVDAEEDDDDYE